jgi:hypothetical protein
LNVDTTCYDGCTNDTTVVVTDPTHALYPGEYIVNKIGFKRVFVICNGTQIAIPKNSTNLEYISRDNASKLTDESVKELILLAKELGVICL